MERSFGFFWGGRHAARNKALGGADKKRDFWEALGFHSPGVVAGLAAKQSDESV
jgi:hypothetical protein